MTTTVRAPHAGSQHPMAWRVVGLLAMANLLNFYDRTIPSIVAEPVRAEFGLDDAQLGLLMSGFTVVYAIAGIALGRIADRSSRRIIMGIGLIVWSLLTALTGGAWSFASLLIIRLGVGIGEASYAPAANSTIADLFPAARRSRATAVFQLGLPVGLIVAFFTTGAIVDAFDSWRAPFLIAAVPGLVVALLLFRIPEPERGASEPEPVTGMPTAGSIRSVLRVRTVWWLAVGGVGVQIISYSLATFLVPLLQRHFGLSLTKASVGAGFVMGVAGLIGLIAGGHIADRARRRSVSSRMLVAPLAAIAALPFVVGAFALPPGDPTLFIALLSGAAVLANFFHTTALPAISEVVAPRMRATAMAMFFAAFYLLGGAFGPVLTGALSDAIGLHTSLAWVLPVSFVLVVLGTYAASRTITADHDRALGQETA